MPPWAAGRERTADKTKLTVQLAATGVNNRAVTSSVWLLCSEADCSAAPHYVLSCTVTCSPSSTFSSEPFAEQLLQILIKHASLVFGVDFLIEEVLRQQVELPILFSNSMCPDELELLQCKLIELVLHLPDGRLLQLGDRLLCGRLFLAGLSQMGFLPCDERKGGLKVSGYMNSMIQNLYTDFVEVVLAVCY